MSCYRNNSRLRDEVAGVQRIALRGPGCISGTGRCEGVLGTGGVRCGQVLGTGGEFQCNNVAGTGGRRNRCKPSCWDLKTPTTVPR